MLSQSVNQGDRAGTFSARAAREVELSEYAEDALLATMELRREAIDLVRAWLALPEVERDQFKRRIETASLRWRRHVIDERLRHLAAPTAPAAPEAPAAPKRTPTRRPSGKA